MRVRLAHLREKHEEDGFAKLSNSLALKIPSSIHTMLQNCPTDNHLEAFGRAIINSAYRHVARCGDPSKPGLSTAETGNFNDVRASLSPLTQHHPVKPITL